MKRDGGFFKFLSLVIFLAIITACGGGGGGNSSSEKEITATNQEKIKNQKYYASFRGTVDIESGTITFAYNYGKIKRRSARKDDIEPDVTLVSELVNWDSTNKILKGKVRITNQSSETMYATHVVITSLTSGVSVHNEHGYDPEGNPYFDHAPGGEKISPSATGSVIEWQFADPSAVNFNFSGRVYADNWHQIAGPGTSMGWDNASAEDPTDTVDNAFLPSLEGFQGKLYAVIGKQDHSNRNENGNPRTGAEVWEYDPTSSDWTQINSDSWGISDSYGAYNTIVDNWGGAALSFNNKLYVSGGKHHFLGGLISFMNDGADIFRYDPSAGGNPKSKWTKVYTNTDANAIYNIFSFDGSIFAGTIGAGYDRAYLGSNTDGDLSYSVTGDSGTWNFVMTNAFGDYVPQESRYIGTAILNGGTINIGGALHGFTGKAGASDKPGVQLYIADTKIGGGGGRLASDWTSAIDLTSDDASYTIASISSYGTGSNEYKITLSGASLVPHVHAQHYSPITKSGLTRTNVTCVDNTSSSLIIAIHNNDFVPATGDSITLTSGANERGWGDTGNATASHFLPFSPSNEGLSGTTEQLWVLTSNLTQGIPSLSFLPNGGEIFSVKNIQPDNRTVDSDWVRRMDLFTATNELGFSTPSTSGGLNRGGNVISPRPAFAGFDTGVNPNYFNDVNGRDWFTFYGGTHEGWLYVTAQSFSKIDNLCRIYKTADGVNWITVTTDGFGDRDILFKSYSSVGGQLYAGGSRYSYTDVVLSHPTKYSSGTITPYTSTFYDMANAYVPSIMYPPSGTLLFESRSDSTSPVLISQIYYEKVKYEVNRLSTTSTLSTHLLVNNGYLGKTLWATDTEVVLSNLPGNLGLDNSKGAIQVEGELINYDAVSGSTLTSLTRNTGSSPTYSGVINHNKGNPVFRTTRSGSSETSRQDGGGSVYGIEVGGDPSELGVRLNDVSTMIVIDDEIIKYTQRSNSSGTVNDGLAGTILRTPVRGHDGSRWSAHSAGAIIYRSGFSGLTRGALGTGALTWSPGEDALIISQPPVEVWVTD